MSSFNRPIAAVNVDILQKMAPAIPSSPAKGLDDFDDLFGGSNHSSSPTQDSEEPDFLLESFNNNSSQSSPPVSAINPVLPTQHNQISPGPSSCSHITVLPQNLVVASAEESGSSGILPSSPIQTTRIQQLNDVVVIQAVPEDEGINDPRSLCDYRSSESRPHSATTRSLQGLQDPSANANTNTSSLGSTFSMEHAEATQSRGSLPDGRIAPRDTLIVQPPIQTQMSSSTRFPASRYTQTMQAPRIIPDSKTLRARVVTGQSQRQTPSSSMVNTYQAPSQYATISGNQERSSTPVTSQQPSAQPLLHRSISSPPVVSQGLVVPQDVQTTQRLATALTQRGALSPSGIQIGAYVAPKSGDGLTDERQVLSYHQQLPRQRAPDKAVNQGIQHRNTINAHFSTSVPGANAGLTMPTSSLSKNLTLVSAPSIPWSLQEHRRVPLMANPHNAAQLNHSSARLLNSPSLKQPRLHHGMAGIVMPPRRANQANIMTCSPMPFPGGYHHQSDISGANIPILQSINRTQSDMSSSSAGQYQVPTTKRTIVVPMDRSFSENSVDQRRLMESMYYQQQRRNMQGHTQPIFYSAYGVPEASPVPPELRSQVQLPNIQQGSISQQQYMPFNYLQQQVADLSQRHKGSVNHIFSQQFHDQPYNPGPPSTNSSNGPHLNLQRLDNPYVPSPNPAPSNNTSTLSGGVPQTTNRKGKRKVDSTELDLAESAPERNKGKQGPVKNVITSQAVQSTGPSKPKRPKKRKQIAPRITTAVITEPAQAIVPPTAPPILVVEHRGNQPQRYMMEPSNIATSAGQRNRGLSAGWTHYTPDNPPPQSGLHRPRSVAPAATIDPRRLMVPPSTEGEQVNNGGVPGWGNTGAGQVNRQQFSTDWYYQPGGFQ